MRARLCLGWLVGAILVAGCDTNQPIRQDEQTLSLSFGAVNALVQVVQTWIVFQDSNGDFLPDDVDGDGEGDEFLWCDPQPDYVAAAMPWSFSVQVDKVLAGEVENITLAREAQPNRSFANYSPDPGISNFTPKTELFVTNRTGYCSFNSDILCNPDNPATTICSDNAAGVCSAEGVCSGDASVACDPDDPSSTFCQDMGLGACDDIPVTRRFVFQPRLILPGSNREILAAEDNIVFNTDPAAAATRGPTAGVCPGVDLGDPNVGGNATPWEFVIQKGDTVLVQARRFEQIPDGFLFGPPVAPISPNVVYINAAADPVSAQLLVDGAPAGVGGNPATTATTPGDPESFIQFFFTSK